MLSSQTNMKPTNRNFVECTLLAVILFGKRVDHFPLDFRLHCRQLSMNKGWRVVSLANILHLLIFIYTMSLWFWFVCNVSNCLFIYIKLLKKESIRVYYSYVWFVGWNFLLTNFLMFLFKYQFVKTRNGFLIRFVNIVDDYQTQTIFFSQ